MFGKINDFKNNLKTLKELESKLGGFDLSNPAMSLENMGIDIDEIDAQFRNSFRNKLNVKYSFDSDNHLPEYAYGTDSGFDLRSNERIELGSLDRALVSTGLRIDIPEGYEIQVRPKSGLSIKRGLTVLNTPGTVDNGYTGEIKVIIINLSKDTQVIEVGDKIAQAVICPVVQGFEVELEQVKEIQDKDRNSNGFGSTGN